MPIIPIYILYVILRKLYFELYMKETYISKCIEALKVRVLHSFSTSCSAVLTRNFRADFETRLRNTTEPCQKLVKMQFSNHRLELVKLFVCSQEWFFFIPLVRPEFPTQIKIGRPDDTPVSLFPIFDLILKRTLSFEDLLWWKS